MGVVLFFVSVVNLILFAALSILPDDGEPKADAPSDQTWLERVVPES